MKETMHKLFQGDKNDTIQITTTSHHRSHEKKEKVLHHGQHKIKFFFFYIIQERKKVKRHLRRVVLERERNTKKQTIKFYSFSLSIHYLSLPLYSLFLSSFSLSFLRQVFSIDTEFSFSLKTLPFFVLVTLIKGTTPGGSKFILRPKGKDGQSHVGVQFQKSETAVLFTWHGHEHEIIIPNCFSCSCSHRATIKVVTHSF